MSIAAVFGMVHALMPGHGKTVIVSYYLGRSARFLSSVGTSAILVLTHVGSAVVLFPRSAAPDVALAVVLEPS
jgi:nickel/cobalt transporter (NicO) family protein